MDPYLGEIRMVGFNYAPQGWALCNGQILQISTNSALYALLGTQFGGDGVRTFALPDLRSRVPVHQGQGNGLQPYPMGQSGGVESVTLQIPQMPAHSHGVNADATLGSTSAPSGANLAQTENPAGDTPFNSFTTGSPASPVQLSGGTIALQGGSQPHENRQPYQTVNFIIALQGIFPPRP
ncbi:tail fiber protein [Methylobacterium sp. J-078]|uniref:phage tail protein n=1 Tax=Methylobacterium sp. J-078 TaxID=2836657 RepID=UPI001FBB80F2|nr:tail fiber protein [Methylobacterium sp. J-078]MCJ2045488.1 tail fiber protein [Methylobacterium sp. J-078]